MIKRILPILFFLAVAMITPVSASLINTSIVVPTNYFNDVKMSTGDNVLASSFYTGTDVVALQNLVMREYQSGRPIRFTFTTAKGNLITGTVKAQSNSIVESKIIVSFDGGTTSSNGANFFNIYQLISPGSFFYVYSNQTSTYYLVYAENNRFNYAPQSIASDKPANFYLDDSGDAYLTLTTKPSEDPIISTSWSSESAPRFTMITYYCSLQKLQNDESQTENVENNKDAITTFYDAIVAFISLMTNTANSIATFTTSVGKYVSLLGFVVLFFMAGEAFIVINVMYVILAGILSVHNTSSWVVAIKRFIRYIDKLIDFYAKIFRYMKDVLKWW